MLNQMLRVMRLDSTIYPEVETDSQGTWKAALVVATVAMAGFIGTLLQLVFGTAPANANPPGLLVAAILSALTQWIVWSYLAHLVGTRIFHGSSTPQHMLRALGYAKAPQMLSALAFIPLVGAIFVIAGTLLALRTGSLAAGRSLGIDTRHAVATMLVSFVLAALLAASIRAVLGQISLLWALVSP